MQFVTCPFCDTEFETLPWNDNNECPHCKEKYYWTEWYSADYKFWEPEIVWLKIKEIN